MTPAELEATKRIAGAVALMMPAVEADVDVPDAVDEDVQLLAKDLGLRGFVAGAMRYSQVALQRMLDRSE